VQAAAKHAHAVLSVWLPFVLGCFLWAISWHLKTQQFVLSIDIHAGRLRSDMAFQLLMERAQAVAMACTCFGPWKRLKSRVPSPNVLMEADRLASKLHLFINFNSVDWASCVCLWETSCSVVASSTSNCAIVPTQMTQLPQPVKQL
jgi:hypothetical protein